MFNMEYVTVGLKVTCDYVDNETLIIEGYL